MDNSNWGAYSVDDSSFDPSTEDHNVLSAYREVEFGTRATFGLSFIISGFLINFAMLLSPPTPTNDLDWYNEYLIFTRNLTLFVTFLQLIGLFLILADVKKLVFELNSTREQQNKNLNVLASKINKR
ncbi:MAG: hypothetical protein L7S56_02665 [Candidatus Poseidonia sp.]|nr:hypothetical protein [Poseidonia sp.]